MTTSNGDMDDVDRSSVRLSSVPLFQGVKAKFPDWSRRFVAICEQKNCADALEVDMEGRLPVDPKVTSTDDAEYA
jgi:hypothetical protein